MHTQGITRHTQAGMVGKQGVAAPVSSRLVCQPCFMCQLLHHCVNDSLLLLHKGNKQAGMHAVSGLVLCYNV
jgi:hypothetical protein